MRRLMVIMLLLAGVGLVLLMLARPRPRRAGLDLARRDVIAGSDSSLDVDVAPQSEVAPSPAVTPAQPASPHPHRVAYQPVQVIEPLAAQVTPLAVEEPPPPGSQPLTERILQEMAEIRADLIGRVSRRPLFLMASDRNATCDLFVASKWDLLDAILAAENLRPEDRDASPEARERLLALVDEALARDHEDREETPAQDDEHGRFWRRSTA